MTVFNGASGNTGLKPEEAYTLLHPGVWNPGSSDPEHSGSDWVNRFCAYPNWYQIDQQNVIGTLQAQTVGDLAAAGVTLLRNYVVRSAGGQISEVVNTYENLGDTRNGGIEFGLNYITKEDNWRKLGLESGPAT